MIISALGERVIVRCDKAPEQTTEAGIIIPDTNEKAFSTGIVVSIGRGIVTMTGFLIEPEVKKGDRVLFQKRDGAVIEPQMFGLPADNSQGQVYLIPYLSIHAFVHEDKTLVQGAN